MVRSNSPHRSYCRVCRRQTNHDVRESRTRVGRIPLDLLDDIKGEMKAADGSVDDWGEDPSEWPQERIDNALESTDKLYADEVEMYRADPDDLPWPSGPMMDMKRNGWRFRDIWTLCHSGSEWEARFEIVECRGCDSLSFRLRSWDERHDRLDPATGELVDRIELHQYYPPPASRQRPDWLGYLPKDLQGMLGELYLALDAGSVTLPVIAARTVLDIVMREKVGDRGSFAKQLDAFCDEGHIGTRDKEILATVIESGHAAAHRGYAPTPGDVHDVLGIVEHLLERLFVHPSRIALMKDRTPKRARSKRLANTGDGG